MTPEQRKEYREWAHGEMELWLNNDEGMYNRLHRIMSHPRYTVKAKASTLKIVFGSFHNGQVKVGSYANFQKIAASVWAEYEAGQYGRFETIDEYLAYYGTIRNNACSISPYPVSRPCYKPSCAHCGGDYAKGDTHCMHCGREI